MTLPLKVEANSRNLEKNLLFGLWQMPLGLGASINDVRAEGRRGAVGEKAEKVRE